jgi:hypothetical protein
VTDLPHGLSDSETDHPLRRSHLLSCGRCRIIVLQPFLSAEFLTDRWRACCMRIGLCGTTSPPRDWIIKLPRQRPARHTFGTFSYRSVCVTCGRGVVVSASGRDATNSHRHTSYNSELCVILLLRMPSTRRQVDTCGSTVRS